ncbi:MAG: aminotransferase class I/II-fold pyridoxal phosphate-dependent enzyme, partial [Gammaproteobacteria bacterium]|nr:aminotransferase class I/II-fold pyridoxal phosphate-dependent enzyme [Gammaproteobacteria bacterium]
MPEGFELKFADRIERLPPYLFARLDKLRDEKMAAGIDVITLAKGDPDLPTPRAVIDRLHAAAGDPANHQYCEDGLDAFRQAICDWYQRRFGVRVDPSSQTVPLIGSKEGIAHIPLALVNPGDFVLVPDPGYPVYSIGTDLVGGRVHFMPLTAESAWLPDLDAVPADVLSRARAIWLCYPNNPTSAVAGLDFYERVIEFGLRNGLAVCQDAAYSEVTFDGYQAHSILEVPGADECAIEFHSLSKTYNMTGWRIGWAVGNARIVEALARVKSNMDSGVFAAVQEAAIEALDLPQSWIDDRNAVYQRRRDQVVELLRKIGLQPEVPKASL